MYYINDSILHPLQLNGSVNYYRKWKPISSEVGVKLKNRENSEFSKNNIVVQIYWTHVRPMRPHAGASGRPKNHFKSGTKFVTTAAMKQKI